MASYESIGSCSLDVDVTASDSVSELNGSVSERTLHSLNLSTPECVVRTARQLPDDPLPLPERDVEVVKKPSYLGLACSLSGYTNITNYDSKLRDGFRSRDQSPGRLVLRSRDASPITFTPRHLEGATCRSACGHFLAAPGATLDSAGTVNGSVGTVYGTVRTANGAVGTVNGSARTANGSARVGDSARTMNGSERMSSNGQDSVRESNRSFMTAMLSTTSYSSTSYAVTSSFEQRRTNGDVTNLTTTTTNGTRGGLRNGANPPAAGEPAYCARTSNGSSKSFIQQRVERLYGPGALAQGFFRRAASCQSQATASPCEATPLPPSKQASLPVLRHLRPEFRAQLSVGSRKAVESRVPTLQQQVSVESVTDILPAAPEVVLPIEQAAVPQDVKDGSSEVKDGTYFLKVLKDEIDVLNALVARTEQYLEEGGLPEEAEGKVRAVIGQARLLVKQKLQQFEGLCHKNMSGSCQEQFPTTADDLAGFWDMVKLQVCQVHGLFRELDALRAAGWREEEVVLTDAVDSNATPKRRSLGSAKRVSKPPANEEVRKAREEARRKMMEERRREMREKNKNKKDEEPVEIFIPQENGN